MNNLSKQKNPFQKEMKGSAPRKYSETKIFVENRFSEADKTMRIGKYKVLLNEVLGKGYSSCVYRGVEQGKQLKQYAVKSIELKGFNATCLGLFQKEIQIHRTLDHQHIVRCYDVYRTKTHIYMIMEYCPHGDLEKYIKTKKKLQQHSILDIFGQIINGYKYLASNSIIHRDLKPANIMRSGKIWKISDFGFATKAQKGFVDQINVGTPMYMPIESLCRSFYSMKTDIFALGIILYQLYHGKTPWVSKSQAQLLRKMQSHKLKFEREIQNKKMKEFVVKSCEMDHQNRLGQDQFMEFCFGDSQRETPLFVHSSNYSTSCKQSDAVAANSKLLAQELNLCRCLYLMVQNIESFLLPKQSKSHFMLVLLKLLLRTVKSLDQDRIIKRLSDFDQYKNSIEYFRLLDQIKDQSSKYQKSYLEHIKAADVKTIRTVNQWFPELSKPSQPLESSFAIRLKAYLQSLLKHNCSALDLIISQDNEDPSLPQKLESFRNLIALQRLVQCCSGQLRGQLGWQPVQNYQSTGLKKSDYLDMRRQIKYI